MIKQETRINNIKIRVEDYPILSDTEVYAIHDARKQLHDKVAGAAEELQNLRDSAEEAEMRLNMEKKSKQQSLSQVCNLEMCSIV